MTLGEYLQEQARHPWDTGRYDCTTFAGDWAITWGRGDPMETWRGRYSTDMEARCIVQRGGGLVALYQRQFAAMDVWGVNEPAEGDVGVIRAIGMNGAEERIGAIWTGRRWAFRIHTGIAFASADFLRAWGPRHG